MLSASKDSTAGLVSESAYKFITKKETPDRESEGAKSTTGDLEPEPFHFDFVVSCRLDWDYVEEEKEMQSAEEEAD
ncbi:hypothetical protein HS088_TW13G01154 [Tripterygium wilfordii]|uniref:Uncharacterized protein n=1 Tax=Tripterygium wilfordii TaxID=458696 RepID=A0A7J7CW72_TRIWF|nr:hypothetical protein HS088_TW13G01154 [Tripterygium wilfordii]